MEKAISISWCAGTKPAVRNIRMLCEEQHEVDGEGMMLEK